MNFSIPLLQSIPAHQAHFCLSIEKFLCEELKLCEAKTTFVVGFSGGVDSTALLILLYLLKPRLSLSIVAAHLNHGIRDISREEANHCKKIASYLDIPFYTKQISIPELQKKGKGLEETARQYRYAFLNEVCREFPNATIALGHHLNDLAEDVLMRLIRGSGWPSLSGMPARDDKRRLCRPLLLTPKQILIDFISALGIPYVQDASNDDLHYMRNRVRHTILPLFLEENPAFLQTVTNLWQMGKVDKELFDELIGHAPYSFEMSLPKNQTSTTKLFCHDEEKYLYPQSKTSFIKSTSFTLSQEKINVSSQLPQSIKISQKKLASLSRPLRLRLYKKVIEELNSHPLTVSILRIDTLWINKKTKALLQLPNKVHVTIERDGIIFFHKS